MDEFVDWMKRRLQLDRKYLKELKTLGLLVNPRWSQSRVSSLVSPMLEFFAQEVEERQRTCDSVSKYLDELSDSHPPEHVEETSESMISRYDDLIAACKDHEVCRKEASSAKAIKEMWQWHGQGPNGSDSNYVCYMSTADLKQFLLPLTERNYRESIARQQTLAHTVNSWHRSRLPELINSHQSRSEEIKAVVARVTGEHSRLVTTMAGFLEATKNNIHGFSSSSFISWHHNERDSESEHTYMKEVVYVNFSDGTMRSNIIFGTVSRTLLELRRAIQALIERDPSFDIYAAKPVKDKALELEQYLSTDPSLHHLLDSELRLLHSFGLLSNPPLIPIHDGEIKRYAAGVPRNKMHLIMSRVRRQDEVATLFDIWSSTVSVTLVKLLTHREDTENIIKDIFLKWDFNNNRPFPPGVKRELK